MNPLIDLSACSLLCLGKFSHSLQKTHGHSPPPTFGITSITAVSSYLSLLFYCRRMRHTNLHPALHSLSSVWKGGRGDCKQLGCLDSVEAVLVQPALAACRSRELTAPSAPTCTSKKPCFILSLNRWLSQPEFLR